MWLYEIYNVPFLRPAFQPLYFYTMKAFLPLAALLLMASSGFCQTEARRTDSTLLVRPLPYRPAYVYYNPNRPSAAYMSLLFEEEAKVLPRLYKANDFAGYAHIRRQCIAKIWGVLELLALRNCPLYVLRTNVAGHTDPPVYHSQPTRHRVYPYLG